jgi:hypothetical protein
MTRQMIVLSSLVALVGLVPPTPAFAQGDNTSDKPATSSSSTSDSSDQSDMLLRPKTPAVFLTGAVGFGMDQSSHFASTQPDGIQINLSGHMTARSFGVGTFLTPRLSLRFEMSLPETLTASGSTSGDLVVESLRVAQTTRTGAVLFGYRTSPGRVVSVEYLGGVLFVSQRQNSLSQVLASTGAPLAEPMVSDAYSYKSAAIAGADVDIALGHHLSVVPEFRAWSLNGTFSTRTSLAFRVNF